MINLPQQWHVYIVDLEPKVGTKPGKQRPCVAIQPSEFSRLGLFSTVILPVTTQVLPPESFPLRVRIPKDTCQLKEESDAIIDQILAWDNRLFVKDLGLLPEAIQEKIKNAVREFLDL